MGGRYGRRSGALVSCSQKECTNPATYTYEWPGAETMQRCCLRHRQTVEQVAAALGFRVVMHLIGCEPPTRPARKPYTAPTVRDVEPPLSLRLYAILRRESDATEVNWYSPNSVLRDIQREVEKELDSETRAKLAAAGFDVRGKAELPEHDPPWMRDDPPAPLNTPNLDFVVEQLESLNARTAQKCSCVNPPRLVIGETVCPACGGSRV